LREIAKSVTTLLAEIRSGNPGAQSRLVELVYPELKRLAQHYMAREKPGHLLQATALVHEAYEQMFGAEPVAARDRGHFFATAAQQMRRILVDHARETAAQKRGGGNMRAPVEDADHLGQAPDTDLLLLDLALQRLEQTDARAARVIELRYFGGLTEREAADALGVSVSTVKRELEFARSWLFQQLRARA
jgi:RNA polymerase sigma factor (TIGR02999 family)